MVDEMDSFPIAIVGIIFAILAVISLGIPALIEFNIALLSINILSGVFAICAEIAFVIALIVLLIGKKYVSS